MSRKNRPRFIVKCECGIPLPTYKRDFTLNENSVCEPCWKSAPSLEKNVHIASENRVAKKHYLRTCFNMWKNLPKCACGCGKQSENGYHPDCYKLLLLEKPETILELRYYYDKYPHEWFVDMHSKRVVNAWLAAKKYIRDPIAEICDKREPIMAQIERDWQKNKKKM